MKWLIIRRRMWFGTSRKTTILAGGQRREWDEAIREGFREEGILEPGLERWDRA